MKSFFNHPWVLLILRLTLSAVFAFAGTKKILDPVAFADAVASYEMLPKYLISIVALGLPPFEVILAGMLITDWKRHVAITGVFILTGIFALVIAQAIARGLEIDCGCFGGGNQTANGAWIALGRDLVLFAIAAWLMRLELAVEETCEVEVSAAPVSAD